ncbi:protein-export chaperone SecB [Acetobacterium wieringae]|uniref:protein-export chaperone SecB n=1 Tax=Acetobacterium wieringae TaxID=52694 RepID=UPI0020332924|nr:protein-export chaperone SecB [Acetobacterium wieringae]URN83952.1 protein-export chaperone SecB [Acetobacterium wieringae]
MELKTSKFQFRSPVLTNLVFKINDDFDSNNFDRLGDIGSELKIDRVNIDEAIASLTLKLGSKCEDYPFYIEITMSADCKWADCDDSEIRAFLEINMSSLLMSYMRPIVSNITNSSRYPVLNLPFIDFSEGYKEE